MRNDMAYILINRQQLKQKVEELGKALTEKYRGKNPLMVCILKGSIVFFADLIREIDTPVEMETMTASSYGAATVSSGVVSVVSKLDDKIRNRDVILVEDIIDSGRTLAFIKEDMLKKGVRSLCVCALLDKPSRRVADIRPDYVGFEVPDEFVVGYGLDFDQKYRNFPEIGVLKPEVYTK